MAILILATFVFGSTYWNFAHPIIEETLYVIGIALAGFGAAGRAWATSYISGQKLKQLVTTGPYSLCRNPLYFFSTILGVGLGFCTKTLTMPILIAFVLRLLYACQIKREEQLLLTTFSPEYQSYLAAVPRFIPSYRHYSEPEEIRISPRLLKRGLFGIAFLLLLIGVLELLEGLHASGLLPVFFHIY
jgi:protein-S-isoprenylcysteine O-methyltransferase Ste14